MRKIGNNSFFFSRDQFWWNGKSIEHNHIDEFTGLRDINMRPIYEMDIVEYSVEDARNRTGVVLWSRNQRVFIVKDIHNPQLHIPLMVEDLELFEPQDLKFVGYLFANPELMVELGVRDE